MCARIGVVFVLFDGDRTKHKKHLKFYLRSVSFFYIRRHAARPARHVLIDRNVFSIVFSMFFAHVITVLPVARPQRMQFSTPETIAACAEKGAVARAV